MRSSVVFSYFVRTDQSVNRPSITSNDALSLSVRSSIKKCKSERIRLAKLVCKAYLVTVRAYSFRIINVQY